MAGSIVTTHHLSCENIPLISQSSYFFMVRTVEMLFRNFFFETLKYVPIKRNRLTIRHFHTRKKGHWTTFLYKLHFSKGSYCCAD